MASVGGTISPEGIVILWEKLESYWNKDKNAICLRLGLTYQIAENWYNEMVNAFAPEVARLREGERAYKKSHEEITREVEYALRRNHGPLTYDSLLFLNEIVRRYENGELRKVVDRLDIGKVRLLEGALNAFYNMSMDMDRVSLVPRLRRDLEVEKSITEYVLELDRVREKVRECVSALHNELGCQKESLDMLRKKLENK